MSSSSFSGLLSSLQRSLLKLDRMSAKIGTSLDNEDFRDSLNEETHVATALVKDCVRVLSSASSNNNNNNSTQWMNESFESEYNRFKTLIKQIDLKQTAVLAKAARDSDDFHLASELRSSENEAKLSGVQLNEIVFTEYGQQEVERRHKEIKQLERDVVEIAQMYQDLHSLVSQQQVGIDVIHSNVESTRNQVVAAESQLGQAATYQSAARKKKCIMVFIVLLIIGGIIGIAVGVSKS